MKKLDPQSLMLAAEKIGNQIARDAIWHGDTCNWVTCQLEPGPNQARLLYKTMGGDLYAGTSGIAYFMAALYSTTRDNIHRSVALGAIRQALSNAQKIDLDKFGFYLGWPGIAYSAVEIGEKLGEESISEAGIQLMLRMIKEPLDTRYLDIVNGAAGALLAAIHFQKKSLPGPWMDFIRQTGEWLVENADKDSTTYSWKTLDKTSRNLTGFAHGAAGIATVFLELYQLTKEATHLEPASRAFAYENRHFDEKVQNWPDYRSSNGENPSGASFSCAWCHGAAGIGLSRLKAWQVTGEEKYKNDALRAIRTTQQLNQPMPWANFSLCHGLFGNAELFIIASQVLKEGSYLQNAYEAATYSIKNYLDGGIPLPNGAFHDWYNPDLMLGLSGMGYFLLRLADPERFQSVLLPVA